MSQRDNSIDIARGVAIIGLLYGHGIVEMHHFGWMFNWFWSFHMPMFAIVAGYFYREKPFFQTFGSSVKTLLLPCLAISLILLFVQSVFIYAHRFVTYVTANTGITNPYVIMLIFMVSFLGCTFIVTSTKE